MEGFQCAKCYKRAKPFTNSSCTEVRRLFHAILSRATQHHHFLRMGYDTITRLPILYCNRRGGFTTGAHSTKFLANCEPKTTSELKKPRRGEIPGKHPGHKAFFTNVHAAP